MQTTQDQMQVAQTIREQLGKLTLMMIGAKNLTAHPEQEGGLSFSTGRVAAGKANYVKIILRADDTYEVTFLRVLGRNVKQISTQSGIYAEDLKNLIESNTGLYTRLF